MTNREKILEQIGIPVWKLRSDYDIGQPISAQPKNAGDNHHHLENSACSKCKTSYQKTSFSKDSTDMWVWVTKTIDEQQRILLNAIITALSISSTQSKHVLTSQCHTPHADCLSLTKQKIINIAPKYVVFLGSDISRQLNVTLTEATTITTISLTQMLQDPLQKKHVWQQLRPYKYAI